MLSKTRIESTNPYRQMYSFIFHQIKHIFIHFDVDIKTIFDKCYLATSASCGMIPGQCWFTGDMK